MKKTIFTLVIAFCAFAVINAQDLTSKKGVPILPEKGDFAIGINAVPFLDYAGNLFNGNAANAAPAFDFTASNPLTIYGKYFKDAKTAYRVMFRIGYGSATLKNYVMQDGQATPDPLVTTEDQWKQSDMNIAIGAGLEKRRGKGRVQGIYGAMALIELGSGKDTYDYGNAYSTTNIAPTFTNWGTNIPPSGIGRYTEVKEGSFFCIGVAAFAGVEYFFAPKMSIGGEFMWGINFESVGEGENSFEEWDAANTTLKTGTEKVAGASFFNIDTDNFGGAINLLFYF